MTRFRFGAWIISHFNEVTWAHGVSNRNRYSLVTTKKQKKAPAYLSFLWSRQWQDIKGRGKYLHRTYTVGYPSGFRCQGMKTIGLPTDSHLSAADKRIDRYWSNVNCLVIGWYKKGTGGSGVRYWANNTHRASRMQKKKTLFYAQRK